MPIKKDERLSVNAYAKRIGVNEKAVRNAIKLGKIVKGYDATVKKIIPYLADKEYGHLHETPKAGHGLSAEMVAKKLEKLENSPQKGGISSENPNQSVTKGKKSAKSPQNEGEEFGQEESYEVLLDKLKITSDLRYPEVTRRQAILEAALIKKKLEEMEDILVRRSAVERILFSVGIQLKKALMAIPARVMDDILSAPTKVESLNILTEELTGVLTSYADMESVKLSNK